MKKPNLILRVSDLKESINFYKELFGWVEDWRSELETFICLKNKNGEPAAIFTTSFELDGSPYLDTAFLDPQPGQRFYLSEKDLVNLHKRLKEKGINGIDLSVEKGFGQTLLIPDPNGYVIGMWEELYLSDEGILELYSNGPALLTDALNGLVDEDYNLVGSEGKWSIRQTVLHFIDSDITTFHKIKFALAESGRLYLRNPYDPNLWEKGTSYKTRKLENSIKLFQTLREHVLEICEANPSVMDHFLLIDGDRKEEVRQMMKMVAGHARAHIKQIWETRKVHSK